MLLTTEGDDGSAERLARAAKLLASTRSIDEIVAVLRDTAREIAGSDGIAVVLRESGHCHYVAEDAIEPLWRGRRFRLEDCVSGWAMLHGRTVIIPDIERDPRVPLAAYAATSMRSLAVVPIGAPEAVAALGTYWCAFIEPDIATVRRLEILAQTAATAFARVAQARPALGPVE